MLSDLTIIIPSFNRPVLLLAAVRQWKPHAAHIVVIDGSTAYNAVLEREAAFAQNVQYIHDERRIEQRLARAIRLVKTEFVMLQSDDDIFIPAAVGESIAFLRKNVEYSAVTPLPVGYRKKKFCLEYAKAVNWYNSARTSSDRLRWLGSRYIPSSLYGVCRTHDARISLETMAIAPLSVYAFWELHHEMVMNGLGRVRVDPLVGWIRRDVADPVDRQDIGTQREWFEPPTTDLAEQFVEGVSKALADATGGSFTRKRGEVKAALEAYADFVHRSSRAASTNKSWYKIVPKPVRHRLKRCAVLPLTSYTNWPELVKGLSKVGVRTLKETLEVIAEREFLEREAVRCRS